MSKAETNEHFLMILTYIVLHYEQNFPNCLVTLSCIEFH